MIEVEAIRLRQILLAAGDISPLLNLGSSTRRMREEIQPHMERELFAPLRAAGVTILHSDLKEDEGIDRAGDILDPLALARLKAQGFRCVLLANLLEHVRDRAAVAAACEELAGPDGLILATAPFSYPYHADPIDTYYRPSPPALGAVFRRSETLLAEEVTGCTFAEDIAARGMRPYAELARTLLWTLAAPIRPKSFLARAHRWFWFTKPYRVSIALVRVSR
jgi:hypothetical protein